MFNKERFFAEFRNIYKKNTGKKSVSQAVVSSVDFLLDKFNSDSHWKDIRNVAYAFATIARETGWTFKPIKEFRGKTLTANQKKYWPSGYYGRGYVQLTWDYNYKKASNKLGIDFTNNPDLALEPENAFNIMTLGMFEGWFTGKKLSDYIVGTKTDYKNARRIINGLDHAAEIAGFALSFEKALRYAFESDSEMKDLVEPTVDSKPIVEDDETPVIETPVDGYPEEPKPGEPAAPEALPGTPVAGGRPGDPPKEVVAVQPAPTSGWGAWVANIRAQWTALGISVASLGSVFSGLVTNPIFIYMLIGIVIIALLAGIIIYIHSMSIKSKEKMERERQAFELTKLQVEKSADPTKYNVVVKG